MVREADDLSERRSIQRLDVRPLTHTTLLDRLADQIVERILSGELPPGQRLPAEDIIAEEYGVSRPLVREALAKLRASGFLETMTGRGTFVRHPDATHLADSFIRQIRLTGGQPLSVAHLYEARAAIETAAAKIAAERADDEQVAALERQLQRMRDNAEDPSAYTAGDVGFHIEVARATGNPLFPTLLAPLIHLIVGGMFETHSLPDATTAGIAAHSRVLERIKAGDARGAQAAMAEHLEESRRIYPDGAIADFER